MGWKLITTFVTHDLFRTDRAYLWAYLEEERGARTAPRFLKRIERSGKLRWMASHRFVLRRVDGRKEIVERDDREVACVRDDWYQSGKLGQRPVVVRREPIAEQR